MTFNFMHRGQRVSAVEDGAVGKVIICSGCRNAPECRQLAPPPLPELVRVRARARTHTHTHPVHRSRGCCPHPRAQAEGERLLFTQRGRSERCKTKAGLGGQSQQVGMRVGGNWKVGGELREESWDLAGQWWSVCCL